jgi:MFS transporter, DHA1 family, multidrug resistance protein
MFPRLLLLDVFDNTLFRLFGHAFFENIGLGPGSALLAGISFALIAVFFVSNAYHLIRFFS